MARIRVVFPLPDGPSRPVIRPAGIEKSSPRRTGVLPLVTCRPLVTTAASPAWVTLVVAVAEWDINASIVAVPA